MRWLARLALPLGLAAMLIFPTAASAQLRSSGLTHLYNSDRGVTTQSDMAFWGNLAITGDYAGFRVFDITNPAAPVLRGTATCTASPPTVASPAGQGDISVWRNLVFRSVDTAQTSPACATRTAVTTGTGFEGIDIFDISNPAAPREVAHVATDCGSHTHTLVPDLANNRVLLYISSYPAAFLSATPTPWGNTCERITATGAEGHDKISIVEVPLSNPAAARVIAEPRMNLAGPGFQGIAGFKGCHDISVFLELGIAAGACLTEGVVIDISSPAAPTVSHRLVNPAIDFCARRTPDPAPPGAPSPNPLCLWHSATFTWDGKYMVFGDEAGGGVTPECSSEDPPNRGAFWLHRVSSPTFPIASFKIPRVQPFPTQTCTAHIMNFIPINDRYVLPSSWYYGGTSVINWTNLASPSEMAYFEIEPGTAGMTNTNTWTTYWYNDYVYANDIDRGFDVFTLDVPWRTNAWQLPRFNPQTQERVIRCGGPTRVTRLQAGRPAVLRDRLTVLGGQPVVGAVVRLRGAGVNLARRTNASGQTVFRFTPRRA
ncbi:MAG TPA: hypothetical protein VHF67_09830, partial [Gaiellaceae bacterium]|nr:hypothetical protein [Gaiellaceae bacterium]